MSIWTIVGYYADTGDILTEAVEAETAEAAFAKLAQGAPGEFVIVGAVPGATEFVAADQDGKTAYATDLVPRVK